MAMKTSFSYYFVKGIGSGKEKLIFSEPDLTESFVVNLKLSFAALSPPSKILIQTIDRELSSI
jgi:hypothetical protein